jgi:hypothetical protein
MVAEAQARAATAGVTGVRTNQALVDLSGATLTRLRPDVQYVQGGRIFVSEVSRFGPNSAYAIQREAEFRRILGPLFGGYNHIHI